MNARRPAPRVPEAALQATVIHLARLRGYRVAHFRPALVGGRWMTPVEADGAGFPDLVLAKAGHPPIFAELKAARGRLSDAQRDWQHALGPYHQLWRPDDVPAIDHLLTHPTEAPR